MVQKKWCFIPVHPNLRAKIDHEDRGKVSAHKWRVTVGTQGRRRVVTSIRGPNGNRNVTLGRFLMKPKKDKQVYPRRFNDELDYRKSNLVVCTLQERQMLLPKKRNKTSSVYRGVSFLSSVKKWRAGIEIDGRAFNLGDFETEVEAALAYNAAALKHYGKNVYQNQVGRKTNKRVRET